MSLLKELSVRPEILVTVFGPLEDSDEFAKHTGVKYEVLPHRYLKKVRRVGPVVRKLVFDHQLDTLHFFTLPVPSKVRCQVVYTLHDLRSHYPKKVGGGTFIFS